MVPGYLTVELVSQVRHITKEMPLRTLNIYSGSCITSISTEDSTQKEPNNYTMEIQAALDVVQETYVPIYPLNAYQQRDLPATIQYTSHLQVDNQRQVASNIAKLVIVTATLAIIQIVLRVSQRIGHRFLTAIMFTAPTTVQQALQITNQNVQRRLRRTYSLGP